MNLKTHLVFAAFSLLLMNACNNTEHKAVEEHVNSVEQDESPQSQKEGFTDFMEQILLGFEMSAISKHMIHTPYKFLGETDLLMNYEAEDENKVNHFVSFHKHHNDANRLGALVYNLDFKKNNSHLVNEYQEKLIAQLDDVYAEWSENYETGYNSEGNYEAEWLFEAGVLLVTVGTDFITVDLREH